jgi:hypothetical protein
MRARGEPARTERLFGEILVGLDRSGQLRRLATGARGTDSAGAGATPPPGPAPIQAPTPGDAGPADPPAAPPPILAPGSVDHGPRLEVPNGAPDPVDRLLALIRDELARPNHRRLTEIEPGRWWLADREDRVAAAAPLDRLITGDDLLKRSVEHTELLAALADGGHRMGMRVWLAQREQARRHGSGRLADLLGEREQTAGLGGIGRSVPELLDVDAIWYVRSKVALMFEVEWTAILGEPLLRRHARIGADERLVRFLVLAPERTDLVRHKLERSPLLRAAMDEYGWHIIKWDLLRTFLAADKPDLDDLEPMLGLDPLAERGGEQMPLFGG